jgi:hypothetical protein
MSDGAGRYFAITRSVVNLSSDEYAPFVQHSSSVALDVVPLTVFVQPVIVFVAELYWNAYVVPAIRDLSGCVGLICWPMITLQPLTITSSSVFDAV